MPFPPPVLPTNRTNQLAQADVHPQDHNAVNAAVNDMVPVIQNLAARIGQLEGMPVRHDFIWQTGNPAAQITTIGNAWNQYNIGTVVLPETHIWDILITVGIQAFSGNGGYTRMIPTFNGSQLTPEGEGQAINGVNDTNHLTVTRWTRQWSGSYNIGASVLTQNGGWMGPAWASVVAVIVN